MTIALFPGTVTMYFRAGKNILETGIPALCSPVAIFGLRCSPVFRTNATQRFLLQGHRFILYYVYLGFGDPNVNNMPHEHETLVMSRICPCVESIRIVELLSTINFLGQQELVASYYKQLLSNFWFGSSHKRVLRFPFSSFTVGSCLYKDLGILFPHFLGDLFRWVVNYSELFIVIMSSPSINISQPMGSWWFGGDLNFT